MQIMNEKGLVTRNESAKTHIYTPAYSKDQAQEVYVGKMIKTLFSGSAAELVMQALGNQKPNHDELNEIKKLIESLEK